MKIIDPFPSHPQSTSASPSSTPPPLTFATLKKAIKLINPNLVIRMEVNTDLFIEIVTHISKAVTPQFKLRNPEVITYNRYDSIPIIHKPNQLAPLKIIRRKEKIMSHKNKLPEGTFIARKHDSGWSVASTGKRQAFSTLDEVINQVTERLRVLDLTTPEGRREVGCDALKITIVPIEETAFG